MVVAAALRNVHMMSRRWCWWVWSIQKMDCLLLISTLLSVIIVTVVCVIVVSGIHAVSVQETC